MDGLSFTNLGNFKIISPGEVTIQTELFSKVQADNVTKKINETDKTEKDKEREKNKKRDLQGRYIDDEDNETENLSEMEKNLKKYTVRLNSTTNMVELVDLKKGKVIESILPDDLMKIVSKTRSPSGILVDRQV